MESVNRAALLLAFRRTNLTQKSLDALLEGGVQLLYVSIDGPRNESDKNEQVHLLGILERNRSRFSKLEIQYFTENLGIGEAVIRGLDWFFGNVEGGLVIEDDLTFERDFVEFAFEGLNRYQDHEDVWMISGTNPKDATGLLSRTAWTTYTMIWGWAGWSHKWIEMRKSLLSTPKPSRGLSLRETQYWNVGARRVQDGLVDTWDTPLAAASHFLGKYCALPPLNLVSNVGFGIGSTNTKNLEFPLGLKIKRLPKDWTWEENKDASANEMDKFFNTRIFKITFKHNFIHYYSRIKDYITFKKSERRSPLTWRLNLEKTKTSSTQTPGHET